MVKRATYSQHTIRFREEDLDLLDRTQALAGPRNWNTWVIQAMREKLKRETNGDKS